MTKTPFISDQFHKWELPGIQSKLGLTPDDRYNVFLQPLVTSITSRGVWIFLFFLQVMQVWFRSVFSYARISLYFFSRTAEASPNLIFASWFESNLYCWKPRFFCPMTHYRVMTSSSRGIGFASLFPIVDVMYLFRKEMVHLWRKRPHLKYLMSRSQNRGKKLKFPKVDGPRTTSLR